jgi:hypothetical protein
MLSFVRTCDAFVTVRFVMTSKPGYFRLHFRSSHARSIYFNFLSYAHVDFVFY